MSERIRRPHLKHTFEGKHVIVAGCAAIAMILGAMSVGGSLPSRDTPATQAEVSSIVEPRSKTTPSAAVGGTGLTRQHTLEVRGFLQQQNSPLYSTTPTTVSKPIRKALTPIFSITEPVRFMGQIVQPQPQPAPASKDSSTAKAAEPVQDETDTAATTPTDDTPVIEDTGSSGETGSTDDDTNTPMPMSVMSVEPSAE